MVITVNNTTYVCLIDVLLEMTKKLHVSANVGHHQVLSKKMICCKSVYIEYPDTCRCRDLIIEGLELNSAYGLGVEVCSTPRP